MSKWLKVVPCDLTGNPVGITGGVPVQTSSSIADGADVNQGTTTDVAVVTDAAGTISGKLRGLVKIFASVWDSTAGRLKVDISSNAIIDAGNSTTTPLGIGGVFTGTSIDMLNYNVIRVSIFADQPSSAGGLTVQFSNDNVNWDFIRQTTYLNNGTSESSLFNRVSRYARIVYTNSGVAQTVFRMQTMVCPNSSESIHQFLDENPAGSDTAILTQSVIVGKTTAGGGTSYVPVKVNPSGAMTAAVTAAAGDVVVRIDQTTPGTTNAVSVTNMVAQGLTDAQLRAASLPVVLADNQTDVPIASVSIEEIMREVATELKVISFLLQNGFNTNVDLDDLRDDLSN